ncbi:MAG: hypothetical protein LBR96_03000 [Treponema sp.]|jgi:hypothetical protein|nr:hypothetical protein [Treponema sp.]
MGEVHTEITLVNIEDTMKVRMGLSRRLTFLRAYGLLDNVDRLSWFRRRFA